MHILKKALAAAAILTVLLAAAAACRTGTGKGALPVAKQEENMAGGRAASPLPLLRKPPPAAAAREDMAASPAFPEPRSKGPAAGSGPPAGGRRALIAALESDLREQIAASGLQTRLCLYDYAADEWILLEAQRSLYPASMIKTLLLLTALEQAEQGYFSLEEPYELRESDRYAGPTRVTGTGILQYAGAGGSYTFEELLGLMISLSDNVAANIIFDRLGAERCAATAERLGLKQSAFIRKMYDLESALPSNVSTAYELTRMLLALQNGEAAGEALTRKGIAMMAATADKGRIGRFTGAGAVVANKVGTVSGLVGDMALLFFPEEPPLALTVVVENPPAREEAAAFIGRLAGLIVEALRS